MQNIFRSILSVTMLISILLLPFFLIVPAELLAGKFMIILNFALALIIIGSLVKVFKS